MDKPLILQLSKTAQSLTQQTSPDPGPILIIALIGALVLLSVLITLLVWLRYLVMLGLAGVSVTMVLRWTTGKVEEEEKQRAGRMGDLLPSLRQSTVQAKEEDLLLESTTAKVREASDPCPAFEGNRTDRCPFYNL